MGTVLHRRIVKASGGADKGELEVETDWVMPGGETILKETASFTFRAGPGMRVVDRITTLMALDKPVSFKDDKEGMLGLRVRGLPRWALPVLGGTVFTLFVVVWATSAAWFFTRSGVPLR